MLSINVTNFITVGLMALIFVLAAKAIAKKFGAPIDV
jgi:hypothetical protein